jgi:hypothetical protein
LDRAGPRKPIALTGDPDLHLRVDGERADPVAWDGATACFRLAGRPGCVRIASRANAPAELGVARDPRVLGVALRQMMVRQGSRVSVMPASDPSLADGFHGFEQEDGIRWTGGDAAVPDCLFLGFDGPLELILHVGGSTRYSLFGGVPGRSAA